MARNNAIVVLNELIKTSVDGEQGFQQAAKIAHDPRLISVFQECARKCHVATNELQAKVTALGGRPAGGGSMTGASHRAWIAAKTRVADSDLSVLKEVERGEDYARSAYSKALNASLPADIREMVQQQAAGATRNHARIRDLRNTFRARARAH